jgi:hypothetical protein
MGVVVIPELPIPKLQLVVSMGLVEKTVLFGIDVIKTVLLGIVVIKAVLLGADVVALKGEAVEEYHKIAVVLEELMEELKKVWKRDLRCASADPSRAAIHVINKWVFVAQCMPFIVTQRPAEALV